MAVVRSVLVKAIENISQSGSLYEGTAVVEIESDLGKVVLSVKFERQTSLDAAVAYAREQVTEFARSLQNRP